MRIISVYSKIMMMMNEIMATRCAGDVLRALVASSKNSVDRRIFQQQSLCHHLSSFSLKMLIYISFLKHVFCTFFNS
jgi:hypothetical protein